MSQSVIDALEVIKIDVDDAGRLHAASRGKNPGGFPLVKSPVREACQVVIPGELLDPRLFLAALDRDGADVDGGVDDPALEVGRTALRQVVAREGADHRAVPS